MLKIKRDINQQDFKKCIDLYFVKSEWFSLTWSCESRQRDTTSSSWKSKLNKLAIKGLIMYKMGNWAWWVIRSVLLTQSRFMRIPREYLQTCPDNLRLGFLCVIWCCNATTESDSPQSKNRRGVAPFVSRSDPMSNTLLPEFTNADLH